MIEGRMRSNVTGWPRIYLSKVQRLEKKISLRKEKEEKQTREGSDGFYGIVCPLKDWETLALVKRTNGGDVLSRVYPENLSWAVPIT
jgi:hypothetical protein